MIYFGLSVSRYMKLAKWLARLKRNGGRPVVNHNPRLLLFINFALVAGYWGVNPASLHAQNVSGTILGQIQDQQGAAIGRVQVTAKNLETGAVRTATADDSGAYRITSVPAGSYEVSAAIAGFKTEVRSGISVTVGSDVAVNFFLSVGGGGGENAETAEGTPEGNSCFTIRGVVYSAAPH